MDPQNPQAPLGVVLGRRDLQVHRRRPAPGPARWATCRPATSSRAAPGSRSASRHPAGHGARRRSTPASTTSTSSDAYHPARSSRAPTAATTWTTPPAPATGTNSILDYCGTQCFYDNVVKPDPTNPNVVYVLGFYGYNNQPAVRWRLPLDRRRRDLEEPRLRPAPRLPRHRRSSPTTPQHIAIGNDGGVWQSHTGGGRNGAGDPLSAADWQNLNGQVDPNTAALVHSTGLAITQFTSMATVPAHPRPVLGRHPGQRHAAQVRSPTTAGSTRPSGDGGQVIVDQTTPNTVNPTVPAYVFGTYFGISPYRFDPSETNTFFGNEADRRRHQPQGPGRVLRPVGAEPRQRQPDVPRHLPALPHRQRRGAASAGDVTLDADQPATSPVAAPVPRRTARVAASSRAVGVADGGDGVYVGTDEGWIQVSPDAVDVRHPDAGTASARARCPTGRSTRSPWTARTGGSPTRRTAASVPPRRRNSGHVFATTDGGRHWQQHHRPTCRTCRSTPSSSTRPTPTPSTSAPTSARSSPTNGGQLVVSASAAACPKVRVWQLDYDATNGVLAAGTHGRGAYTLTEQRRRGRAGRLQGRRRHAGRSGQHDRLHDHGAGTSATPRPPASPSPTRCPPTPRSSRPDQAVTSTDGPGHVERHDDPGRRAASTLTLHAPDRPAPRRRRSRHIVDDGIVVTVDRRDRDDRQPAHDRRSRRRTPSASTPSRRSRAPRSGTVASYIEHIDQRRLPDRQLRARRLRRCLARRGVRRDLHRRRSTTTPTVAAGDVGRRVRQGRRARRCGGQRHERHRRSRRPPAADPSVSASATLHDDRGGDRTRCSWTTTRTIPSTPRRTTRTRWTPAAVDYGYWDLADAPGPAAVLPDGAHERRVVHRQQLPGTDRPVRVGARGLPRRRRTAADVRPGHPRPGGRDDAVRARLPAHRLGRLGGPERQGHRRGARRGRQPGHRRASATVPIDHSVLGANFEDQITPIGPATAAFTDDTADTDALTVADGQYKVVFLAFPFEAYGVGHAEGRPDEPGLHLVRFVTPAVCP